MICYCEKDLKVTKSKRNYLLPNFNHFCSANCFYKCIQEPQPKGNISDVLLLGCSILKGGNTAYSNRLNKYFKSKWEAIIAEWLTVKKIDWYYEPITITFKKKGLRTEGKWEGKGEDTRTYTPDFFLPKQELFIEVKGLWMSGGKKKLIAVKELGLNIELLPYYLLSSFKKDLQ